MQSPLNEARQVFLNAPSCPRCVVVADGRVVDMAPLVSLFDVNGWAATWLDVSQLRDANSIAVLPHIFHIMDLVYIIVTEDNPISMDVGYIFGVAKLAHKPVFVEFRCDTNKYDYPAIFHIADGIGLSVDDLALFIDTFDTYGGLSDYVTRARAVATKIKGMRIIL